MIRRAAIVMVSFFVFCGFAKAHAEEITLLFSGETHAMLYQCSCPKERDGGVARRTTLIKELRKKNPRTLLVDSGGFFAGGLLDEYTQNTQLDQERTRVQLAAMGLMGYDAVGVGDDEFNFGREFLEQKATASSFPFLSCNSEATKDAIFRPFVVKEVGGLKVGIIAVTSLSAKQKTGGLALEDPVTAVSGAVKQLKDQRVGFIILLSNLGESQDVKLIAAVPDIDVVVVGRSRGKNESSTMVSDTLFLRPSWQGRKLGKAVLTLKNNKIVDSKVEEIRLSDKIADDRQVLSILPRCFSDANCSKVGMAGSCQNPGNMASQCMFQETVKIPLTVISSKECTVCNAQSVTDLLKKQFPGLVVTYVYYPDPLAARLVKNLNLQGLPVYLLGKEIEREGNFELIKKNVELKGDYYMVKPQVSGFAYFPLRKNNKGRIDLFASLYDKNVPALLDAIREFKPVLHFLAVWQENKFDANKGQPEVEEYLRSVCVQKYYPDLFWEYVICRSKNSDSSWWDGCLISADTSVIKACAMGTEGRELLKENTALNKELQVMFGPTYLKDNQEIFSTTGTPTKEELKKILGK